MTAPSAKPGTRFDLVVVGGTPAGIAMAVRAAREGASVLLVNHTQHLGGMLSSGLGVWDSRYEGKRAPVYDEVRQSIFDYYRTTFGKDSPQYRDALPGPVGHNGKFEPHVAESVLTGLVMRENGITVLRGYWPAEVLRKDVEISSVTFRALVGSGTVQVEGRVFADCTYEGDLLPLARVHYRIGRESRDEFNEDHAGVVFMGPTSDPQTAEARRAAEELARLNLRKVAGFERILPGSTGEGDQNVQASNYRTILSSDPANRIPIPKPEDYDPTFLRMLELGGGIKPIPNQKIGLNRPQLLGPQNDYVEGDWTVRRRVMDEHWRATMGLLWFYQQDGSVPEETRRYWREFGLAKDEFPDNGHRPYEFYFREGRRLEGRYTYTQRDVSLIPGLPCTPAHADSIAITEWYVDSHACSNNRVPESLLEGKVMLHNETLPGQVPYRTLLPKGVDNLLVPVCLSASHVAWNTVRLEATWMHIGESAAYAALQAIKYGKRPADIDCDELVRTLAARGIMVSFLNDVEVSHGGAESCAAQYFATQGFFSGYEARLEAGLKRSTASVWADAFRRGRSGATDPDAVLRAVYVAEKQEGPNVTESEFASLLNGTPVPIAPESSPAFTRGRALVLMYKS